MEEIKSIALYCHVSTSHVYCRVRPYGFGCIAGGVALVVSIFIPTGKDLLNCIELESTLELHIFDGNWYARVFCPWKK